MAKLEIPVVVDIDAVADLIEELKDLQTYKLSESDNMILVDRDDVVEIFVRHVKAKQREPERKTGRWIPCSERLPEEGQGCLVCDGGTILIDTFIGHGNPYNWRWYVRDYEAWMPLPEPYQAERREE